MDTIVWRGATSDADGAKTATGLTSSPVAERSRFVDRQPARPGYRRWRVWQKVPTGDWCRQKAVPDGLVDRRPEPDDPGIAAHSRVEPVFGRAFCVSTAILYSIRCGMRSQWRLSSQSRPFSGLCSRSPLETSVLDPLCSVYLQTLATQLNFT